MKTCIGVTWGRLESAAEKSLVISIHKCVYWCVFVCVQKLSSHMQHIKQTLSPQGVCRFLFFVALGDTVLLAFLQILFPYCLLSICYKLVWVFADTSVSGNAASSTLVNVCCQFKELLNNQTTCHSLNYLYCCRGRAVKKIILILWGSSVFFFFTSSCVKSGPFIGKHH